jgi:hypothetical protein
VLLSGGGPRLGLDQQADAQLVNSVEPVVDLLIAGDRDDGGLLLARELAQATGDEGPLPRLQPRHASRAALSLSGMPAPQTPRAGARLVRLKAAQSDIAEAT